MKKIGSYLRGHWRQLLYGLLAIAIVAGLMLYKLGSLVGGLSASEQAMVRTPLGWHGLYAHPLYLPLQFVRSTVFFVVHHHGQTVTRLSNVLFGAIAIGSFWYVVRLWHNVRTALLTGALFATSAWVLHVSRLASFDVLYLCAATTVLLLYIALIHSSERPLAHFISPLIWALLLYIPGMVWVVLLEIFWLRTQIKDGWKHFSQARDRALYIVAGLVWLPLLGLAVSRPEGIQLWLGLPVHLDSPLRLLKHFVGVFVHVFLRGPQYPQLWLVRTPLLDIFTLMACVLGLYYYCTHLNTPRSRMILSMVLLGAVLVGLGGPVSLSFLVPFLYVAVATGIAYLLHRWLKVFPLNPLARNFGIGLIVIAVVASCLYNVRSYFVAWPHNQVARNTFRYRP